MSNATTAPQSTPSTHTDSGCCGSKTQQVVGAFCWWENLSRNVPAARAFYGKVFGWEFHECKMESGEYLGLANSGRQFGGMMTMPACVPAEVPSHWAPYVNVDDVDASLVKAKSLGGKVVVEGTDIPQVGRFGVIADPTGAWVNLFKGLPGVGCQGYNGDNGSFCWTELHTSDPVAAAKFYGALLGWTATTNLIAATEHTTFSRAGCDPHDQSGCVGGMMKVKAEWGPHPSNWLSYVWVDDLEKSVSTVASSGGKVCCPPSDIPGIGRFAVVTDPAGTSFGLFAKAANPAGGCCGSSCGCSG
ncbi:MAG: VOC family protein [Phycisphaerales bacterium]|nr:VOC family protein [Phycisphaerales bacterium]